MRLRIVLPKVTSEMITIQTQCTCTGCRRSKFHLRLKIAKPFRDMA